VKADAEGPGFCRAMNLAGSNRLSSSMRTARLATRTLKPCRWRYSPRKEKPMGNISNMSPEGTRSAIGRGGSSIFLKS